MILKGGRIMGAAVSYVGTIGVAYFIYQIWRATFE